LVRSSTDARTYQKALQDAGVPAVVRAGPDLFAQPEVLLFAAALSLSAQRDTFMGSQWNPRSLPRRIQDELGVTPEAEAVIRAAYARLRDEGLPIEQSAPDRLVSAAESIASRIYTGVVNRNVIDGFRTPELREFLAGRSEVRRVFPQSLLQMLMAEGGLAIWDVEEPRARMAMFHLGQLSSLVTGIETPGWTSPAGYRHQVTSLLLWASKQASPEEAPLLVAPDAVTVSTIHSCKGLEFAAVFVADVVSRRFPSQLARRVDPLPFGSDLASQLRTDLLGDNANLDGERRLMYVAMTRAERYLFVTSSKPSSFFSELHGLFAAAGGRLEREPAMLPVVELRDAEASREARLVTSFSDLRYFLECPHDFYLRKVLGFTPTIDQAFGYGRGVHNLMREVHLDPASWAADAANREALERRLRQLIEMGLFYLRHTTGTPADLMRAKGVQVVADYVTHYQSELAELTFEPEREFEVLLPEQNVLVTGAIDVVRRDDPPRVTIIDFKSGEAESDKHQALDHDEMRMQVSLYAVAAKQELQYEPERGLVRYLGEADPAQRELVVPLTAGTVQASRQQVQSLARDIQERRFRQTPATRNGGAPKNRCVACDYRRLCGLSLAG
jgi:DNA helicase-2/ATP-dependent DNA helicase PcrA